MSDIKFNEFNSVRHFPSHSSIHEDIWTAYQAQLEWTKSLLLSIEYEKSIKIRVRVLIDTLELWFLIFEDLVRNGFVYRIRIEFFEVVDPRWSSTLMNRCYCCPRAICERCFWPIFYLNIHFAQLFIHFRAMPHRWDFIAPQGCEKCKRMGNKMNNRADDRCETIISPHYVSLVTWNGSNSSSCFSAFRYCIKIRDFFFKSNFWKFWKCFALEILLSRIYTRDDGRWFQAFVGHVNRFIWMFNLRVLNLENKGS